MALQLTTSALTESLIKYADQSARADARVGKLEARLKAMVVNPQPLGLGLPPQVTNYAHEAVSPPPELYKR